MEEFKMTSCIMCLNIVNGENCKVIDETTKYILSILLLKQPVEVDTSVMCSTCAAKVFEAYQFKTVCTYTEASIFPYVNSKNGETVDLKDIYLEERGEGHLRATLNDDRICRLCMQIVNSGFTSVNDLEYDLICTYIPEVNFYSTEEPVLCTACVESLKTHCSFLKNCLGVQKFENDSEDRVTESQFHIKMEETEIKSEESGDMYYEPLHPASEPADYETNAEDHISEVRTYKFDMYDYTTEHKKFFITQQLVHNDSPETKMYNCDTCNFGTKRKQQLIRHKFSHKNSLEIQMYKCDRCNFETKHKTSLTSHELIHKDTSELQMYTCDRCNFKTKHKRSLISHQRRHKDVSEVQMYACDTCDFATKHKKSLVLHELKHKGDSEVRMYKCDKCNYTTKYKAGLVKHQLTHKDASEVQIYKCDMCNFDTKYRSAFLRHRVVHKDVSEVQMYKCEACKFETKYKSAFVQHRLIHKNVSEVQMYRCDTCNFESKHKKSLKAHRLKHKIVSNLQLCS